MSDIKKASEEKLHALHLMTAEAIAELFKKAKDDPDMMLRVLREARGFLKDNNVTADMNKSPVMKAVEASIPVEELPFVVTEALEEK